jgi:hypothetical protein
MGGVLIIFMDVFDDIINPIVIRERVAHGDARANTLDTNEHLFCLGWRL